MKDKPKKYSIRTYIRSEVCAFRKTKELYGGLSNMAAGYPIKINKYNLYNSEALYQSMRYPHRPDIQKQIIGEKSPMAAKMKSKSCYSESRVDWEEIKVDIMRWCLRVKLAQNFIKFGRLLESTGKYQIVEEKRKKDDFWGARVIDENTLKGVNALGRLLMELRENYNSENRYNMLSVSTPKINNFLFIEEQINPVSEIRNYFDYLLKQWNIKEKNIEILQLEMDKALKNGNRGASAAVE